MRDFWLLILNRNDCRYLLFLGPHEGSLQPWCSAKQPRVPHPTRSVSYAVAVADFKAAIERAGHPGALYAEHSNKRGGATHAAKCGVSSETICEIGQWKNVQTAQLYIDESTPTKQKRNRLLQSLM